MVVAGRARVNEAPRATLDLGPPAVSTWRANLEAIMLTRILAAGLMVAMAGTAGARAVGGGETDTHRGEILGVDRLAGAVTVRVVRLDQNETHVFHIVDGTVIKDKATGRRMGLADLRSGDTVIVTDRRQGVQRLAIEILVKREKDRRGEP